MANTTQFWKSLFLVILAFATVLAVSHDRTFARQTQQNDGPRKMAFVVGVSQYQKDGLTNLKYAHKDANDLSTELANNGFEVTKLIGRDAKHKEVRRQLQRFIETAGQLDKNDVVWVSFSGHGVQKTISVEKRLVETPFFCVSDTLVNNAATMISLNWVLEELKTKSGCSNNLLIVDACRNNPDKGARTLDGSTVKELPTKISMLFSSSPGQKSFESETAKQGVFTHVLLKGLRGDAANTRGQVKWASLATYVLEEVPLVATELMQDQSILQRPNLVGNIVRSPILVKASKSIPKRKLAKLPDIAPEATVDSSLHVPMLVAPFGTKEIASAIAGLGQSKGMKSVVKNDVGMEFRLIPAGRFMMGSPESEIYRQADEHQHEVEVSRPYYMGTHEVTQWQWERVMGENPSSFSASGKNAERVKGMPTSSFPVETVSWEDSQKFIERLNSKFVVSGYRYRLPTEAEWEYACRAGSETVFHFGDSSTDQGGNYNRHLPYGSGKKGAALRRPAKVGSYEQNAFGLFDMHGNVWEWCSDWYNRDYHETSPAHDPLGPKVGSHRVSRGGSWAYYPLFARSARRDGVSPTGRGGENGFRVVLSR